MSIIARLKQFLELQGIKPQQLASQTNLKPAAVHKALSSEKVKGLHSDTVAAIMRRFPELDPDWLILGVGEMLRKPNRKPTIAQISSDRGSSICITPELEELLNARIEQALAERLARLEKGASPAQKKNRAS